MNVQPHARWTGFIIGFATACLIVASGCASRIPRESIASLQTLHGDLLKARSATEFYVRSVRRVLPSGAQRRTEAERLYEDAYGKVNSWIVDLQTMIRNGQPLTEEVLAPRRDAASAAVVNFNTFADTVLQEASDPDVSKSLKLIPTVSLSDVMSIGQAIADAVGKRRAARDQEFENWAKSETALLEQARWQRFDEIK